ncbi:MAG: response regulator [Burkholderiaceae bacterium]
MRRILLLDDELNVLQALRRAIRLLLSEKECRLETFSDPEQALLRVGESAFDVVIADYWMPGLNGIEFLKAVKHIQPDAVRLMLSASTEFQTAIKAVNQAEVFRFIAKPWTAEDMQQALGLALAHRDKLLEDRRLADEMRVKRGTLAPQEFEARRLEEQEPGITKVEWGPDGAIHLDIDEPKEP